jgi:hypothetical protein
MTNVVMTVLAISGLVGLAIGLIVPRLPVATGIALFLGILATFLMAATSGTPVPMIGWMSAVVLAVLAAALGWVLRGRGRA